MKASLLSILLFLGLFFSASAQAFRSQLVLGINASQIDGDELAGYNKPGLLAGALVGYPVSDLVTLQSGLIYSEKGSRYGENDPFPLIWRLNYLEIPVQVRIQTFENIYFSGGLSVNYLITAKSDIGAGFEPNRTGLKDFDLCYTLGAAYQPFDRTAFQVRLTEGFFTASQWQYFRNRSVSFAILINLNGA